MLYEPTLHEERRARAARNWRVVERAFWLTLAVGVAAAAWKAWITLSTQFQHPWQM